MRNARWFFFSENITKNNNIVSALFATVHRITNPVSVASELVSKRAGNEFMLFYTDKIQKIRPVISAQYSTNSV